MKTLSNLLILGLLVLLLELCNPLAPRRQNLHGLWKGSDFSAVSEMHGQRRQTPCGVTKAMLKEWVFALPGNSRLFVPQNIDGFPFPQAFYEPQASVDAVTAHFSLDAKSQLRSPIFTP